jgi:transposase
MLRSRTVNMIHELLAQGKSIHSIASTLELSRNTVRKYLRGTAITETTPRPRRKRGSKIDPFKSQIAQWIGEDHLYNCATMFPRLQKIGYMGSATLLREFVHDLRPPLCGHHPVLRYETAPGEQLQFDWGEFRYQQAGTPKKLFGFTAILSYSRMRYVVFAKRCDAATLIRCLMEAFEYFQGLPKAALTDRMKTVLLSMDGKTPLWHPRFADFMASIGVSPRVCKAYTPQTKGKVERSVSVVKYNFWPGVHFTDLDDLNHQALEWCECLNQQVHRTTRARPVDRWSQEALAPLPAAFAWERFATEDRKVSWDGYVSYDGVLYGLPSEPACAGAVVQVREHQRVLTIWSHAQHIATWTKHVCSGEIITHPEQFRTVVSAAALRRAVEPLGHQVEAPQVSKRSLVEYDQLCGLGRKEVQTCTMS